MLRAIIVDLYVGMSEIKSFAYTNSEDPAEPSLYIKVQDIGTGRSETALNVASQVLIFRTGPRSAVGNVSGYRCVSDCRSRGREFDPGPVPYFCGD